jgi:hypothetical protein
LREDRRESPLRKRSTNHYVASNDRGGEGGDDDRGGKGEGGGDRRRLYGIPNLVNRVLMEHFTAYNHHHSHSHHGTRGKEGLTTEQRETLTQLLLAVIVEFAEPHFVNVTLHRERERERRTMSRSSVQLRRKDDRDGKETTTSGGIRSPRGTGEGKVPPPSTTTRMGGNRHTEFDDRAVSWATSCISQLIGPPGVRRGGDEERDDYRDRRSSTGGDDDDYAIPALDALLAASGPHDGLLMEKRMRSELMHSLRDRRMLQRTVA